MYWYCMEKFYSDHSLVLSQAWYMGKIPSPYEESISHSKALPLNLRLYGEQGLMGTQNTFFVSRSWRDEKT